MKKLVQIDENEGLDSLLGERVILWCARYFYFGVLVGVNDDDLLLDLAHVVYETGPLTDKKFKDAQPLPGGKWYVRKSAVESYGRIEVVL